MGIKLKIVTPEGTFIDDKEVDIINAQTIDGEIGILKNMIPLVSALKIGTLSFKIGDKKTFIHIHRGIIIIDGQQCKIITERLYLIDEKGDKLPTPKSI